jgi:pyruvate, water dikinase
VLVTDMTDPDWEPVMKRASAIVTNRGGRTCHAAIIARELGIPAVVGCGDATQVLKEGELVTVSCAEGDTGNVYRGICRRGHRPFAVEHAEVPGEDHHERRQSGARLRVPAPAQRRRRPGAAGIHHRAHDRRASPRLCWPIPTCRADLKLAVEEHSAGYADPVSFYVDKLAEGVATLGAAFYPKPVIVRLSDFKSNEYSSLVRRLALRAARGKSDARLPRRIALHRRLLPRLLSSSNAGRCARCATRWA